MDLSVLVPILGPMDPKPQQPQAAALPQETFEEIVARNIVAYRPPEGRVDPTPALVANPAVPQAARDLHARHQGAGSLSVGGVGMIMLGLVTMIVSFALREDGVVTGQVTLGLMIALGFALMGLGAAWDVGVLPRQAQRAVEALSKGAPLHLSVPKDVGAAYTKFGDALATLRASTANDSVVAEVEAHQATMDDMVCEAARLRAKDASDSMEGIALRDRMVRQAAQVQALVEMDRRRHHLALASGEAATLLALPEARYDRAANIIEAETVRLSAVLDACSSDTVIAPVHQIQP